MKIALGILVLALLAGTAQADTLWTYAGNPMAPCSCALDGTFTVDSAGNATSWNFTDGTHTLNNSDSTAIISLATPVGWSQLWHIVITGTNVEFLTYFYGSAFEATDESIAAGMFGYLQGNRGTLIDGPIGAPEPGSLFLVFLGIVGFFLLQMFLIMRKLDRLEAKAWEPLA